MTKINWDTLSKRSLGALRGWCTRRKGHVYPKRWYAVKYGDKTFHMHYCLRCHSREYKEPDWFTHRVTYVFKKRYKQIARNVTATNPLLEAFRKNLPDDFDNAGDIISVPLKFKKE